MDTALRRSIYTNLTLTLTVDLLKEHLLCRVVPLIFSVLHVHPTDTFEVLMRQAENHTNVFLRQSYRSLADEAAGAVGELFTAVGLFLTGSELGVDESVQRFFDALFPPVYGRLIQPALGGLSTGLAECVRSSRRELRPFGATPAVLTEQIVQSGLSGKLFLQALHLGIEVINTTDHLQMSRECKRALLKMHYCPFCQVEMKSGLISSTSVNATFFSFLSEGFNPVEALHGLLPERDAGLSGEHGGDRHPLEGVCPLAGGPVSADARTSGFRASAPGSSRAAPRCYWTCPEKCGAPLSPGQIIRGEGFTLV